MKWHPLPAQVHLCLQYTWCSFKRTFTARPLIHQLLLQTSALSLSAAEEAAQCSMSTVEGNGKDIVEDKWPHISLVAVCCCGILKALIQHSLGLNSVRPEALALRLHLTISLPLTVFYLLWTLLCIPTDRSHNCSFVMQTNLTSYNDSFALAFCTDYTPNSFPPPLLWVCTVHAVCL